MFSTSKALHKANTIISEKTLPLGQETLDRSTVPKSQLTPTTLNSDISQVPCIEVSLTALLKEPSWSSQATCHPGATSQAPLRMHFCNAETPVIKLSRGLLSSKYSFRSIPRVSSSGISAWAAAVVARGLANCLSKSVKGVMMNSQSRRRKGGAIAISRICAVTICQERSIASILMLKECWRHR